jgi:hypothetical protein
MPELTLEALAARVEALEHKVAELTRPVIPGFRPGTGDWDAAAEAARQLREGTYDFDAWREQREYDLKHANDHTP